MSNTDLNCQTRATRIATNPSLAVMIPTLNRPDDLEAALRSLLFQTVMPVELLIVDQSRDDESERRVQALFEQHKPETQLHYIRDPKVSGLTEARNLALGRNHCDVILFLDDDVELEADCIERLMEGYASDPDVTGISGLMTNYTVRGFADRAWHSIFLRGPFHDDRLANYLRADELRMKGRIPVTRFTGAMMSFRTRHIGDLRFDGNLRGPCEGEDVDFCLQLPPGSRLEIDPRARLIHKVTAVARRSEHWIASVVRGNIYLYYRHHRHGINNRLACAWALTGYSLLAVTAAAKRMSIKPWTDFVRAVRTAKRLGLGEL